MPSIDILPHTGDHVDMTVSTDDDFDVAHDCPRCGDPIEVDDLQCETCGEPLDDPSRGICGFCGVATSERCSGCSALVCWECSSRTGVTELTPGAPWCPDCRPAA
jgi:hypothetical protein